MKQCHQSCVCKMQFIQQVLSRPSVIVKSRQCLKLGRNFSNVPDPSDSELVNPHNSGRSKDTEIKVDIEKPPYTVSREDFKWVERVLPRSCVPTPPKHDVYPTPSGWIAPSEILPNLPYFVRRTRFHLLPVIELEKPKNSKRWLTKIMYVEGDIWALEKELVELVRPTIPFDPATRVHELAQFILIKGLHKNRIEEFLYEKGF